ncbi:uncharacterized protein LOC133440727 [Cololabis saira]|uniref:uncharacterized protein LOC133440727 n=1 Tax=Cololabis saira TaxID=129043 RepID=UPI002AD34A76|nr:uncharacterized protein LOC133440727 [Cololabis saira]
MSESDEQIRALTELVEQLQAENNRLRDRGNVAFNAETPGPSSQVAADSVGENSVPERVYIYAPRERKCPRFSGVMAQDGLTVEDWVEEARKSLSVRHTSPAEQAAFLSDLLDGEAKREIKFGSPADRANPESIFNILLDNFGCDQTYVTLQRQFFQRRQQDNESIREFSHALLHLMELLKGKDPRGVSHPELVIRDTFIENVRDAKLQRELAHLVQQHPNQSFSQVRNVAIRWEKRGPPSGTQRARAYSCDAQASGVDNCDVDTNAISVKPSDELWELKECLRRQQVQLDAILEHLGPSSSRPPSAHNYVNPQDISSGNRPKPYKFQPDGKPICMRCNRTGHIARFCRVDIGGLPGGVGQRGQGPRVGVQVNAVEHQEN